MNYSSYSESDQVKSRMSVSTIWKYTAGWPSSGSKSIISTIRLLFEGGVGAGMGVGVHLGIAVTLRGGRPPVRILAHLYLR